ncbi:crossover junction endonuclease EME1 isoform X1 [Dendroctonus ponderosae]|nr:crossover junction endonuclease EME1 isoform X1 [Dendroctonus ponderosae]KAH1012513.1 hypothetical protein HUJ05_011659 [Dendroctonus ponderosae]
MNEESLADSDDTVIVDKDELNKILKNYSNEDHNAHPSTSKRPGLNIYSLDDFSDAESVCEPVESRYQATSTVTSTKPSWQINFSAADFLEDSGDSDVILTQISQAEATRQQTFSKELQSLLTTEKPIRISEHRSDVELEDAAECDLNAELEMWKNNFKANTLSSESNSQPKVTLDEDNDEAPKTKRGRRQTSAEKEAEKAKKREQKEVEKENRKQVKNALKNVKYFTHPERILDLTVNIDEEISNKSYGKVLETGLTCGYYKFAVSKQIRPNLISWTKNPTGQSSNSLNEPEKQYMLIIEVAEFIEHISNNTLTAHIQSLLILPEIEHLTIAVMGLRSYYKYLDSQRNKDFKNAVADAPDRSTRPAGNIPFKYLPKIPKKEIDKKLVELQFFCKSTYVRLLEMIEDLVGFVIECTKSVANRAERLSKSNALQAENEYFAVNNRDCVPIDKDGNGLFRLWSQCLVIFPSASLETAEAITSVYPTLHSLIQAYKSCDDEKSRELLLQNILVRRRADPLDRPRKLGPELSKKVYKVFFSKDNVSISN